MPNVSIDEAVLQAKGATISITKARTALATLRDEQFKNDPVMIATLDNEIASLSVALLNLAVVRDYLRIAPA